jgi:hypothetical protein
MVATGAPAFTASATGSGAGALSGTSATVFYSLLARGMHSVTPFSFSTSGTLVGAGAASASTSFSFSSTSSLTGRGIIASTSLGQFSTQGSIQGAGAAVGTSPVAFGTSATMWIYVPISGSTSSVFSVTATGNIIVPISGSLDILTTLQGALLGSGRLVASTSFVTALIGTGTIDGVIRGSGQPLDPGWHHDPDARGGTHAPHQSGPGTHASRVPGMKGRHAPR